MSEETRNIKVRAIIADDESLIRMDLREMLTNLGYLVVGEVGDGRSAVNLARELRPDIVIMDIKMPDMDGIEVIRELRKWSTAPVIVLSARSREEHKVAALDAGADDYLTKPFGMEELLARPRRTL